MIFCPWCNKRHEWDWCSATVTDALGVLFKSEDRPDIVLELFLCSCGGTLAVTTEEPRGATLFATIKR